MSNPYAIFADASPSKQQMLQTVWKELYAALARLDEPKAARIVTCVVGGCFPGYAKAGPHTLAVARFNKFGAPGCQRHIDMWADRPGGWPLDSSKQDDDPEPANAAPPAAPRPPFSPPFGDLR